MLEDDIHYPLIDAVFRRDLAAMNSALANGARPDWFDPVVGERPALHRAAAMGFIAGLEKMVSAGGNVNALSNDCMTPLIAAAEKQQVEAGRWLLKHGADPLAKDPKNGTPLFMALGRGYLEFAQMLLDECPSLKQTEFPKATQEGMSRASPKTAQWLLEQGVSPESVLRTGQKWLAHAQTMEQFEDTRGVSDLLLAAGANVNGQNHQGWTALHEAATYYLEKPFLRLLQAGASPDLKNSHGITVRKMLKTPDRQALRLILEAWEASNKAQDTIESATKTARPKPL